MTGLKLKGKKTKICLKKMVNSLIITTLVISLVHYDVSILNNKASIDFVSKHFKFTCPDLVATLEVGPISFKLLQSISEGEKGVLVSMQPLTSDNQGEGISAPTVVVVPSVYLEKVEFDEEEKNELTSIGIARRADRCRCESRGRDEEEVQQGRACSSRALQNHLPHPLQNRLLIQQLQVLNFLILSVSAFLVLHHSHFPLRILMI